MPSSFTVSIIIPVYNAERYLERAVASALEQPQTGEVILIEDCSPDGSLAICEKLATAHPGKVRLLRHPDGKNHGAGPSRNVGIRAAKHPFIAFLDADDYYLPGRFDRDEEILMGDESIDGVYNALGVELLDDAGRTWWEKSPNRPPDLTTVRNPPPPEKLFTETGLFGRRGHFSFDTATFRRYVFDKAAYFSNLRLSQDSLLAAQLAAKCCLVGGITDKPVAMRGVHGDNRIRDRQALREARDKILDELMEWSRNTKMRRPHLKVLYTKHLNRQLCYKELVQTIRKYPYLLTFGTTYITFLKFFFVRQKLDELIVPGFLPNLREAIRGSRHLN